MKKNVLNDLDGSQWLRLTRSWWTPKESWVGHVDPLNSWWETDYPIDPSHKVRSYIGCAKPPSLGRDLTLMFTKKGQWVLDPFAGTGGLILGAALADRKAVAIELQQGHVDTIRKVKKQFRIVDEYDDVQVTRRVKEGKKTVTKTETVEVWEPTFYPKTSDDAADGRKIKIALECGPCMDVMDEYEDGTFDFAMTDPPYGVGHKVSFTKESKMGGFASDHPKDIANLQTTQQFTAAIANWGEEMARILKDNAYMAVFMGDRYMNSEYVPLGWATAVALRNVGFTLKAIIVWRNKSTQRPLKPYAVGTAYIPNIIHQNILILRKEP